MQILVKIILLNFEHLVALTMNYLVILWYLMNNKMSLFCLSLDFRSLDIPVNAVATSLKVRPGRLGKFLHLHNSEVESFEQ